MSEGMTLEELSEADASGRMKDIYAELRHLTAVPVVALIFRHLATYPGLLEQTWASMRVLLATGLAQDAGAETVSKLPQGLIPPIDANVRTAIGLGGKRLTPVLNAVEAYNRANATNLLVMLCLLERLKLRDAAALPVPARAWQPPAPIAGPLSRMVSPSDMPDHVRRMVNDLAFGDRTRLDPVVPSLLRHLCDPPGLLAILHIVLVPKFKDGTLAQAVGELSGAMVRRAAELAPYVGPLPLLAATAKASSAIQEFTGRWIPQMILIGFGLKRSLGGGE